VSDTVTIGFIDREGCVGCVNETQRLMECCAVYVDLASACVTCDAFEEE